MVRTKQRKRKEKKAAAVAAAAEQQQSSPGRNINNNLNGSNITTNSSMDPPEAMKKAKGRTKKRSRRENGGSSSGCLMKKKETTKESAMTLSSVQQKDHEDDYNTDSPVLVVKSPPPAPSSSSSSSSRQEQEQEQVPQAPFVSLQSQSLLRDLLYPLSPQEFMTRHFRQRAVHIQTNNDSDNKNNEEDDEEENNNNNSNNNTNNNNGKKKDGKRSTKKTKKKTSSSNNINRYQPIIQDGMYNLNTEELVKDTSSDSIFVWLAASGSGAATTDADASNTTQKKKTATKKSRYENPLIQSIELTDTETALALHQSTPGGNHALYCRAPPLVEQNLVSSLLKDTGLGCGQYDPSGDSLTSLARGEVEMFLTSRAEGITDWHYDFQENFTLQLSGSKKWTLQKGVVKHPLRACTPHYKAPDVVENQLKAAHVSGYPQFCFDQPTTSTATRGQEEENDDDDKNDQDEEEFYNAVGPTESVILKGGDALYFPAGMWHKIEVLEPGVSINISLMATNYATITCQALQHLLLQRDEWRQVVVNYNHHNNHHDNNDSTSTNHNPALEHLKTLLQDLPSIITEFVEQQGGASSILPPVLLQPPNFQNNTTGGEGDDDDDDDDDDGTKEEEEEDDDDAKPPAKKAKSNKEQDNAGKDDDDGENSMDIESAAEGEDDDGAENDDDNKNDNDDADDDWDKVPIEEEENDEGDDIVDACQFEYPSAYHKGPCPIEAKATSKLLETHTLICNPLASLLRMDEITRYYNERLRHDNNKNNSCDENNDDELLFVLNINYAGVESHESSIRVILRDDPEAKYLDKIRNEPPRHDQSSSRNKVLKEMVHDCPNLIHCLLYYGFCVLVPKKK